MLWQFMRRHLKFGLFFCLYVFLLLVVLLLLVVVSFELRLLPLRGSKGLAVWISLSSKKEFVKLTLLQSGQVQEHEECISCLYSLSSVEQHFVCIHFGSAHNGLLYGYLGRPCGKCHRV